MEKQQFDELIKTLKARGTALANAIASAGQPIYNFFEFTFADLNPAGAVLDVELPFFTLPAKHIITDLWVYPSELFADWFPPAPPSLMSLTVQAVCDYPGLPPTPPPPVPGPYFAISGTRDIFPSANLFKWYSIGAAFSGQQEPRVSAVATDIRLRVVSVGATMDLINCGKANLIYKTQKITI